VGLLFVSTRQRHTFNRTDSPLTHRQATKAWLAAHPRFHVHHTPPHAPWLNQMELFFSTLARLLKRGEFASREDLIAKLIAFH